MDDNEFLTRINGGNNGPEDEFDDDPDIYELVENFDPSLTGIANEGTVYIGREWSSIGDDETGKQFKDSVQKIISEKLGDGLKCRTHEETIYN